MKDKNLLILWAVSIAAICLFIGHYSNILLDFGREVYYPQQILEGKVLYKDLFVIYGPFSYLLNALLYKIFGQNILTLYVSGSLCSLGIVSGIYLISKRFLSKFLSLCVAFSAIAIGIMNVSLFNFTFPYSWAILYGITAFIFSVYFLIKYFDNKKNSFLIISALLTGVCGVCKYEFLLYFIIYFGFLVYKKQWKALISLISIPVISMSILFLQGLRITDLITSAINIKHIAQTQTLKYFYQSVGVYFHPKILLILLFSFIQSVISVGILCLGVKKNNKFIIASGIVIAIICSLITKYTVILYLPILFIITAIWKFKSYKNNFPLLILVISGGLICLRSFWGLLITSYGDFYASFIIACFLSIIFSCYDKKYQTIIGIYLLLICTGIINLNSLKNTNTIVSTNKGSFYTFEKQAKAHNELISYIQTQTKPDDKIVIIPEGLTINFLTGRKSDDYYNSLLPLYIESFGEDEFINRYKTTKPEYIVLSNESMKSYGVNTICNDYAYKLCGYISENYILQDVIDNGFRYLIFKHK